MWQALGQVLPISVAVACSSVPIMATILILLSPKRKKSAVPFLIGWVLGLTVVAVIMTIGAQFLPISSNRQPQVAAAIGQIILGVALVVFALISWHRAAHSNDSSIPKWLNAVGTLGAWAAFGVAFGLNLRPKAIVLAAAVGLALRTDELAVTDVAIVIGVYVVISCTTVVIPIVATLISPAKMESWLVSTRSWIAKNNRIVTNLIMLFIGVVIAGDGLTRL